MVCDAQGGTCGGRPRSLARAARWMPFDLKYHVNAAASTGAHHLDSNSTPNISVMNKKSIVKASFASLTKGSVFLSPKKLLLVPAPAGVHKKHPPTITPFVPEK